MSRKVLVVDDEKLIVKGIRFSLEQDGMDVDCAYDGEEALEMAQEKKYDIILLDLMLPKMDGFEVCQQIREFSNVPIVMLTAKGEDMDKILGLDYGADDYITKPFNILEVKARIKAIMRRARSEHEEKEKAKTIESGDLKLDCESRRVFIAGKEINLTAKEFDVLDCTYSLKRDVDSKGRPSSNIYGGQIRLHVESTDDTSILENMTNQFKPHSGSIVFKKGDEEAKMKELTWENGYITEFTENIDIVGSQPMTITFVVSAQVIKIGGAQFEQNWPK